MRMSLEIHRGMLSPGSTILGCTFLQKAATATVHKCLLPYPK